MEGDSVSAILKPQCIGFLRRRPKVHGTDLTVIWFVSVLGQSIGDDHDGHSMEECELEWYASRQDYYMNHCTGDH